MFHYKYDFFSDHLPVGIEVNGKKIVTLNCLNKHYVKYIIQHNNQGYKDSAVTKLHSSYIHSGKLDQRELYAFEYISNLIKKGHICLLQEVSFPFMIKLTTHFDAISIMKEKQNYCVTIFPQLPCHTSNIIPFVGTDYHFIHTKLKDMHIINVHVPWHKSHIKNELYKNPYIKQLYDYVATLQGPIIIGGDFNTNLDYILFNEGSQIITPYYTHIDANFTDTNKKVAKFDGFILVNIKDKPQILDLPDISRLSQLLYHVKSKNIALRFKPKA
jgi:hypothetical protein